MENKHKWQRFRVRNHVWRWWCPTSCLGKPWIHDDSCHSCNARPSHGFSAKGKPLDLGGLGDGGVSSLLRNYYINLLKQVEKIQHSIMIHSSLRNATLITNTCGWLLQTLNVGKLNCLWVWQLRRLSRWAIGECALWQQRLDPAETLEDGRYWISRNEHGHFVLVEQEPGTIANHHTFSYGKKSPKIGWLFVAVFGKSWGANFTSHENL